MEKSNGFWNWRISPFVSIIAATVAVTAVLYSVFYPSWTLSDIALVFVCLLVFISALTVWLNKGYKGAGNHPFISGIAATVAVLTGSFASFFTPAIRETIGLPGDTTKPNIFSLDNFHWHNESGVFLLFVSLSVLLFAWSKSSDTESQNTKHKELSSLVEQLVERLQRLPSDDFLQVFQMSFASAFTIALATTVAESGENKEDRLLRIDKAIRDILSAIIGLAIEFDEERGAKYSANIMLYDKDGWDEKKLALTMDITHLKKEAHDGTLTLFRKLSTTSKNQESEPDLDVAEIAVPVHKPEEAKDKVNLLAGAPKAFRDNRYYRIPSQEDLFKWLDEKFADANQSRKTKDYFSTGPGKDIKSFVSIPIQASPQQELPVGVLNIHRSTAGLLEGGEKHFLPIVSPFIQLISYLLAGR